MDGNDVIYGGPGDDSSLWGERGDNVIYGGDGNDFLSAPDPQGDEDKQPDKLYCGAGRDEY
jgi:Ca2+-binding RTX toxin-like protein